jgi:hypothetical protein
VVSCIIKTDTSSLLAGINALFPTLLSPNSLMIGLYWAVLYVLQGGSRVPNARGMTEWRGRGKGCMLTDPVGFCLTLLLVRQQVTKVSRR